MSDALRIPIVADASHFKSEMQAVQRATTQTGAVVSKVGGVVGEFGQSFAFAGAKVGAVAGSLAQLAGSLATGGPFYAAISAASLAVAYFGSQWMEAKKKADDAIKEIQRGVERMRGELKEKELGLAFGGDRGKIDIFKTQQEYFESVSKVGDIKAQLVALQRSYGMETAKAISDLNQSLRVEEKRRDAALERLAISREIQQIEGYGKGPRMVLGTAVEGSVPDWALYPARPSGGRAPIEYDESVGSELDRLQQLGQMVRQQEQERQKLIQERQQIAIDAATAEREAESEAHRQRVIDLMDYRQRRRELDREIAVSIVQETASAANFAGTQLDNVVSMYGELAGARAAGNAEAVKAIEEQEKWLGARIAAETMKYIGSRMIAEGTILIGKGIGEGALTGNPGAAVAIGAGAFLVATGTGLSLGGAGIGGYAAGASGGAAGTSGESSGYVAGRLATGSTENGNGQVVVHHHYYGPVFGDEDSAARAVYRFQRRGARLEHAA